MGKPITGLLRWRARETARYNLSTANCVICVSEPGKSHLIDNWSVPSEKIVVLPNAADVERFSPDTRTRSAVRGTLGIDNNPLILFVGGFYKWHDVGTLLEAFARVLTTWPDTRLLLVGDGEQRQAMMQRAVELSIEDSVQFTGLLPHSEVPQLMAAADIAVVPYPPMEHELWLSPLKLFEYMASGTAIIASRVGQLTEVVQDGRNGLLVPPGESSALEIALKRLIEDPSLRVRLGEQARDDAVNKYSWDHYMSRLERLFAAVIARTPVGLI
jgi:glycosyltransferase involved in cell wall biosynthesis